MTKHQKLKQALTILEAELYPSATEVFLLKSRLSCTKCVNQSIGECKLYGPIPKEHIEDGCPSWNYNGTLYDKWDKYGALLPLSKQI